MRVVIPFIVVLFFSACSTKVPDDKWRYNTYNSYENAQRYFLEDETTLFKSEFNRAKKYASQSADFMPLARLQLSYCALCIAVLEDQKCSKYEELVPFINSKELESYSSFLSGSLRVEQIEYLPKQYIEFSYSLLEADADKIRTSILKIEPLISKMVAASLAQKYLNDEIVESIIEQTSHFGYKKGVLAWMGFLSERTHESQKATLLKRKMKILQEQLTLF